MTRAPVFVLGVSRRSGTNFVASVLLCHSDAQAPEPPLVEDHLIRELPALAGYADAVQRRWAPRWGASEVARNRLLGHLAAGVQRFVEEQAPDGCVITRTPSLDGLSLVPELLPDAKIIVVTRDGRSVTGSLVRGFSLSFERAAREWRRGARELLAARDRGELPSANRIVVRYEDLVADFEPTVDAMLRCCELDPGRFDWDRARQLPVLGSSFTGPPGRVSWRPVADASAVSVNRFSGWSPHQHDRFAWIAGDEQRRLGYDLEGSPSKARLRNLTLDLAWPARAPDVRHGLRRWRAVLVRRLRGGTSAQPEASASPENLS